MTATYSPWLRWLPISIAAAILLVWELTVQGGWLSAVFFPPPTLVVSTLVEMTVSGEIPKHFAYTVSRVVLGFLLGGSVGVVLGMTLGWSDRLRVVIDPFIAALHPIPKVSMLPLIMIVLGIGFLSKTVVVALAAFFPMVINSMAGVRQIDPQYFEVARSYGSTPARVFRRVVIQGSLPTVLAGVRIAVNTSLSLTIAVELITAENGLGSMIYFAWQTLRTEELYAALVVLAVLGYSLRLTVAYATTRLVPWHSSLVTR